MNSEMMIALVGGGGATLGAVVGGGAAVVAAHITGKRAERTARLAYLGPLDVARRAAQREAFVKLLSAADSFLVAAEPALEPARSLLDVTQVEIWGEPVVLIESVRNEYRAAVRRTLGPVEVAAAGRHVYLEGPIGIRKASEAVVDTVQRLSHVFANVETRFENDEGEVHALSEGEPSRLHRELKWAINEFSRQAGSHLNQR